MMPEVLWLIIAFILAGIKIILQMVLSSDDKLYNALRIPCLKVTKIDPAADLLASVVFAIPVGGVFL